MPVCPVFLNVTDALFVRTGDLGAAVEEVAALEDPRAASVTRQCAASLVSQHSLSVLRQLFYVGVRTCTHYSLVVWLQVAGGGAEHSGGRASGGRVDSTVCDSVCVSPHRCRRTLNCTGV